MSKPRPSGLKERIRPNRLGAMIRLSRTVSQKSIRDVAKEIGTSPATLMRIEHGEAFDVTTMLRLLTWLLEREAHHG